MLTAANDVHALIRFLRRPQDGVRLTISDWENVLRASRRGYLLSRVAHIADRIGLTEQLPAKVQFHFRSALRLAESHARSVNWEIRKICEALAATGTPIILLKGAAYIKGELEAGNGRLLSDVDIMVPHDQLEDAEKALLSHGWFPSKLNAYDQRYYRTWMHELPPMHHLRRGTTIDLHHTILPPTALLKPDVEKLWRAALPLNGEPNLLALAPVDMILHSAVHLFHDGELEHGVRDLVDIDALLGQFSVEESFWGRLVERADELDLSRPLYYALRYCNAFLHTPIPLNIQECVRDSAHLSGVTAAMMDFLVSRSLGAILESDPAIQTRLCQFSMYVRSHYLRMPLYLLIPHLLRKQFIPEDKRV